MSHRFTGRANRIRQAISAMSSLILSLGLASPVLAAEPAASAPTGAAAPDAPVMVNQVGFTPGAAKRAYLPAVAALRGDGFAIVDAASGQAVLRGTLGPAADWPAGGQRLRAADFSALRQPGRYRLQADGLPPSAAFTVADDALAALDAAALKAFYFNRAGTPLLPRHAGPWARPAGHEAVPVKVHASAASASRPAGTLITSPKGWYDAGDYNQYIVNSGISTYTLLAAWEHFPAFFKAQQLGIPETGNGLPDILNEALWNLDWMLSLQDPDDGGVYHKLTNLRFDGMVMPHQATADRWVVAKTTAAALNLAATMAAASRVFKPFDAQRPGYAATCLAAARRAWAWAQAHPDLVYRQPADVHTGEYGDDQLTDERAWAAAELYLATGEAGFWQAFQQTGVKAGVPSWNQSSGLAYTSLAQHLPSLPDEASRQQVRSQLVALADQLASTAAASADGTGLQAADYHWGSISGVLNRGLMLVQAYRLAGQRAHLDTAQALLDMALGRNGPAMSLVTGFGERAPRHPHHRPSEADGVADPVPGFIVGGPNAGLHDLKNCPVPYPSTLPALAYLDHVCSYASNEVAINWNAPLVYLAAAVQVLTPKPNP